MRARSNVVKLHFQKNAKICQSVWAFLSLQMVSGLSTTRNYLGELNRVNVVVTQWVFFDLSTYSEKCQGRNSLQQSRNEKGPHPVETKYLLSVGKSSM